VSNNLSQLSSISLHEIVKSQYRDYQIYTLMDRAIPYLQDGLKPCQRRILFTLWRHQNKGLMKVSSATGLVLTLHPHGPASIESSLVNMAQDFTFSNNYPLIDKKGYFGERMETAPAAGRYIECQLGGISKILLFDDMNQVEMQPNYDEKVMEPVCLLPKLPLMLINGSEGIGTGFSSVIPSFHHRDIIDSMVNVIEKGKPKKLKPYVHLYQGSLEFDVQGRIVTKMKFQQDDKGDIYIVDLPKGYDSHRIYKHLNKFIEKDFLKDYIDSSVNNTIKIELIFKRGVQPTLDEVEKEMGVTVNIVPNYTLISERGVKVFKAPEEIITIFTDQRLKVVKRRYELLALDCTTRLQENSEIIRFIEEKHFIVATKSESKKTYMEYLEKKGFKYINQLSEMPIYKMTIEEVRRRELLIKEDKKNLKEYKEIVASDKLVREKLMEELRDVREKLDNWLKKKGKN
jgi:DNA gyrase subunit A